MSVQDILVGAIVVAAGGYLVWKLGLANRTPRRKRVDVPAKRLVRKKTERGGRSGGCH